MKPFIFFYKLILIFENVNILISYCSRDTPFLKNGECFINCEKYEIDSKICILDNEIIKTQNLTNIIQVGPPNYHYINLITTENGDLIYSASCFPNNNNRIFFGLTKEGRGYFYKDNKRTEFNTITLNDEKNIGRFEFEIFPFKLFNSSTDNNEYLMTVSKSNQYLEIYDLKQTKSYFISLIDAFGIYNIFQEVGTIFKLKNKSNNVYIMGFLGSEYFCTINNCQWDCSFDIINYTIEFFYLIQLQFSYLNIKSYPPIISKIKVGKPDNIYSPTYSFCCSHPCANQLNSSIDVSSSKIISCYETTTNYILCFHQKKTNNYTITVYSEDLVYLTELDLHLGDSENYNFFKCIHYFYKTGIFSYFSNSTNAEIIFQFKDYDSNNNKIIDHYDKVKYLSFGNNLFERSIKFNDIIKINNQKFYYVTVSVNKAHLYIVSINNYYEQQFTIRFYKINILDLYNYVFGLSLRATNYNNFLSLASSYSTERGLCSSLIIFSYPNSTDINMNVLDTLFSNNDIKINNITLDLNCKLENNIFGYINIGIQIKHNCKKANIYLSSKSNRLIETNHFLNGSDFYQLNLIISKSNIYYNFKCQITYYCVATEPDFEIYNNYSIKMIDNGEEGNKEDKYFDYQKTNYIGRYSDYNISLVNDLTIENCEKNCELCELSQINKCITCKYDYNISDNYKLCFDKIIEEEKNEEKTDGKLEEKSDEEKNEEEEKGEKKIKEKEEEKEEEEIEEKKINEKQKERIEEEKENIEKSKKELIYEEEDDKSDNISDTLKEEIRNEEKSIEEEKNNEEKKIDDVIENKENKEKLYEKEEKFGEYEEEKIEGNYIEDNTYNNTHEEEFDGCSLEGIKLNSCKQRISEEKIKSVYQYFEQELINDNYKAENILFRTLNAQFQLSLLGIQLSSDNYLVSNIDLGECENEIKRKNNISSSKQLIIFKLDLMNYDNTKTFVYYELYNPDTLKRINIQEDCEGILIDIYTPVTLDDKTLFLYSNLSLYGYNLFDENGPFYNNICAIYTTQKGSDILLIDRKKDIFNTSGNLALCQQNCKLVLYNEMSRKAKCNCDVQRKEMNINLIKNINNIKFDKKEIKESFFESLSYSNFRAMKCYKIIFEFKHFFRNIGRAIMTFILILLILLIILYLLNGKRSIKRYFKFILKYKYEIKHRLNDNAKKNKNKHSSKHKHENKNKNKSKHHHHHHHHHKSKKSKEKKESNDHSKDKHSNKNLNEQKITKLESSSSKLNFPNPPKNQSLVNNQDNTLNKDTSNIESPKYA